MRPRRAVVWASGALALVACAGGQRREAAPPRAAAVRWTPPRDRAVVLATTRPAPIATVAEASTEAAPESFEHVVEVCAWSWMLGPGTVCRERLDDLAVAKRCATECAARRKAEAERAQNVEDVEAIAPPRASARAIESALHWCIVGVVESSRPASCRISGPFAPDEQQDCDARCAADASAEIRRRVGPRLPLSPPRRGDGM